MNLPDVPMHCVAERLRLTQPCPGRLTIADAFITTGVPAHIRQHGGGISPMRIPCSSAKQAVPELPGCQLELLFTALTARRYVRKDGLRTLAVADAERSPPALQGPTLGEAGAPDVDVEFLLEAIVPAETPRAVIDRLRCCQSRRYARRTFSGLIGMAACKPCSRSPRN
jgi:hypothetical protein